MTIYRPDGTTVDIYVSDDSYRQAQLMGDDCLTLRFQAVEVVDIPLHSWCFFEQQRYILYHTPQITKQNERNFDYVMPMYTAAYLLSITLMRNRTYNAASDTYGGDLRLKFPLTATPREHLAMIAACLNEADKHDVWEVDYGNTIEESEKLVSYEFSYCIDAIRAVAQAFSTEYEITETTDRNTGVITHYLSLHDVERYKYEPLEMSYGRGKGFASGVIRKNNSSQPPIDRLYIQGGEQNIPTHYGEVATTDDDNNTTYNEVAPNNLKSTTLLFPKSVAVFYNGDKFFFCKNPRIASDGSYIESSPSEVIYDDTGNRYSDMLAIGTPCYLTSADGRSVQRVRHAYYDPDYTPRLTNVEGYFDASAIYPMRIGYVSDVATITQSRVNEDGTTEEYKLYDIYDASPDCPDYSDLGLDNEKVTIIFQDGMLAGREFDLNTSGNQVVCELVHNRLYDENNNYVDAYRFEICPTDTDNVLMPNDTFAPRTGDHYIIFHCAMPTEYISGIAYGAEYRALREAVSNLHHIGKETYTFSGTVQNIWSKNNWDSNTKYFALGSHIKVKDVQLFGGNGLVMRVTGIKQYVDRPHEPELTLSNALVLKYDWAKQLSKAIQEVRVRPAVLQPNQFAFPRTNARSQRVVQSRAEAASPDAMGSRFTEVQAPLAIAYTQGDAVSEPTLTIGAKSINLASPSMTNAKYSDLVTSIGSIQELMIAQGWINEEVAAGKLPFLKGNSGSGGITPENPDEPIINP